MLDEVQSLVRFWNKENEVLDEKRLNAALKNMSKGDAHMAMFFGEIWLGREFYFDMVAAASEISLEERMLVIDWFSDPFWPRNSSYSTISQLS